MSEQKKRPREPLPLTVKVDEPKRDWVTIAICVLAILISLITLWLRLFVPVKTAGDIHGPGTQVTEQQAK